MGGTKGATKGQRIFSSVAPSFASTSSPNPNAVTFGSCHELLPVGRGDVGNGGPNSGEEAGGRYSRYRRFENRLADLDGVEAVLAGWAASDAGDGDVAGGFVHFNSSLKT